MISQDVFHAPANRFFPNPLVRVRVRFDGRILDAPETHEGSSDDRLRDFSSDEY